MKINSKIYRYYHYLISWQPIIYIYIYIYIYVHFHLSRVPVCSRNLFESQNVNNYKLLVDYTFSTSVI